MNEVEENSTLQINCNKWKFIIQCILLIDLCNVYVYNMFRFVFVDPVLLKNACLMNCSRFTPPPSISFLHHSFLFFSSLEESSLLWILVHVQYSVVILLFTFRDLICLWAQNVMILKYTSRKNSSNTLEGISWLYSLETRFRNLGNGHLVLSQCFLSQMALQAVRNNDS